MLQHHGDYYTTPEPLPEPDIEALWGEAASDLLDIQPLADYLKLCGHSLSAVLTGAESALETLFPGGSYETVDFLYHHWAIPRYYNGIVRSVAESAANQGRPLRVLEVGAGTGGTTAAVLPALPHDRTIYHFTDVSDFFLGRAQDRFAAYPFVRYGLLNIENDPQEQGYAPGSFDLIIGANVLHATTNLDQTLQHVRWLLAPGSVLALYEATHHPHWFDITIGLIEGWSRFEDEWRRNNPLLTAQVWTQALAANGFQSVAAFPEAATTAETLLHHVIVAQTPPDLNMSAAIDFGDVAGVSRETTSAASSAQPDEIENFLNQLAEALPTDRQDMLIAYVRRYVARILRIDPSQPIERRQRLMDMGVDSLMAVELRSKLSAGLKLAQNLPATLIFDYPTIEAIAEYLERILIPEQRSLDAETPAPAALADEAVGEGIEGMSDDEVEALLLKKLKNM
jgi:SAM-dependent methyltransferase